MLKTKRRFAAAGLFCVCVGSVSFSVAANTAQAATRTISFTAANLVQFDAALNDAGTGLGISTPGSVQGSFTIDDSVGPFRGFTGGSFSPSEFGSTSADYEYISFYANVGGIILTGAPPSSTDYVNVYDGTGTRMVDSVSVFSGTDTEIDNLSSGVFLDYMQLQVRGSDNAHFSGTAFPTLAELNSLSTITRFNFRILDSENGNVVGNAVYDSITFAESAAAVSEVPVPAALPLFISALGFFGFVGWRRRKAAAA